MGIDSNATRLDFRTYAPYFENWSLLFEEKDGHENIGSALKAFIALWAQLDDGEIKVQGRCRIHGNVFKSPKFEDGDVVDTSRVKAIARVQDKNAPRGMLRINTSHNTYYAALRGYNTDYPIIIDSTSTPPKEEELRGFFWKCSSK